MFVKCNWYLASHGCDLDIKHEGDHKCIGDEPEDECGFTWKRDHPHTFTCGIRE